MLLPSTMKLSTGSRCTSDGERRGIGENVIEWAGALLGGRTCGVNP
jgi:hypothetical protein